MQRIILLILIFLLSGAASALDIANAKDINKKCALCHGIYGQGTPGTLSPRLAGLPASYLAKELKYYRDGVREYAPMVVSSSIKGMSDEDIDDISKYLAGIDLRNLNLPKIPLYSNGSKKDGKEVYKDECTFCHKKTGLGKAKKGIPPIAGQYGSYLFSQMTKFQDRSRYHDDDPDDDTFSEYSENDYDNLIAYLTTLPAHAPVAAPGSFAVGMSGMSSMRAQSTAGMVAMMSGGMSSMQGSRSNGAMNISGQFRVTPTGEIILNPLNQDMRAVAGLSGDFRITPQGIEFIPR